MSEHILRISDVEQFHWRLSEAEAPISFSANGNGLSLAGAVELACIEARQRSEANGVRATFRVPGCPIWSLLRASRWPDRSGRTKLRDGGVAVLVLPVDPDAWWTQCLRDLLGELTANGFPTYLARGLAGAVAEMADNLWLHSETDLRGLLAYQVRRRKFAFSVADTGVGILASLRTNRRYKWLRSSMEAIRWAIEPGVSRNDGGGMGFPSLLHALADLWGSARLRSGESRLLIDRGEEHRKSDYAYLPHLPGVHVSVRCGLNPPGKQNGIKPSVSA